jgi:hypothetical protein
LRNNDTCSSSNNNNSSSIMTQSECHGICPRAQFFRNFPAEAPGKQLFPYSSTPHITKQHYARQLRFESYDLLDIVWGHNIEK